MTRNWHLITPEYPPQPGGVSDYSAQIAGALQAAGESVHVWSSEFQGFTPAGLQRVGALLDSSPAPRRLLVQWVPHGYGYRSMNIGFCRWLAGLRAGRLPGNEDEIDLVVHEPGLGLWEGGVSHHAIALVHRAMLAILLRSATRVWGTAAAWKARVMPYGFGRNIPFEWLPVASNVPVAAQGADASYEVGYFGQYDEASVAVVMEMLNRLTGRIALMGRGAERVPIHEKTVVIGEVEPGRLSRAIASCGVMCHHYPDGVSGRRTTAMASLAHGKAVATVEGRSTEEDWRGKVALSPGGDGAALADNVLMLLRDGEARERLARAGADLYRARFSLDRTIEKLLR